MAVNGHDQRVLTVNSWHECSEPSMPSNNNQIFTCLLNNIFRDLLQKVLIFIVVTDVAKQVFAMNDGQVVE